MYRESTIDYAYELTVAYQGCNAPLSLSDPVLPISGDILGDVYTVDKEIGKGGMARVYSAFRENSNIKVAIKIPRQEAQKNDQMLAAFEREGIWGLRLVHPHLINVFGAGSSSVFGPFIVMEHIEGPTLRETMAKRAPVNQISAFFILEWARQIFDALVKTTFEGVVHRDLKPENLLFTTPGTSTLKLIDFGVAIKAGESAPIAGTPHYSSPEAVAGAEVTPKSDIYSAGVLLYELTTDRYPLDSPYLQKLCLLKHIAAPVSPTQLNSSTATRLLESLVLACLEVHPENRPTAAEAAHHCAELLNRVEEYNENDPC